MPSPGAMPPQQSRHNVGIAAAKCESKPVRKLRLGIDLDGVVADFNDGWTTRYNRDFPDKLDRDLKAEDVVEWDAPTTLSHFPNMSAFWTWAETCAEGRSLFHGLDPYEGALDALHQLRGDGHHLVILTTKPHFSIHDTYDWLARHKIPSTEIHILDDKTQVDCDVYLDDANHNLAALTSAHPAAEVCRYVRPWNGPISGAVDVFDWVDFQSVVAQRST
jgi:5'(3')-deoxyribonucleotidase